MTKQNHNFMALQGIDIDDEEYAHEFGVPPNLAYTPELNYWMLNHVYENNVKYFMDEENMKESEAIDKAAKIRDEKRAEVRELMARKGLL